MVIAESPLVFGDLPPLPCGENPFCFWEASDPATSEVAIVF